jgi:hypothetical protein
MAQMDMDENSGREIDAGKTMGIGVQIVLGLVLLVAFCAVLWLVSGGPGAAWYTPAHP